MTPLADGRTGVVMRDFGYEVSVEGSGDTIDVAIGFQTDFASVPRPLWWLFPCWGKYGNAAVVHDWLYWTQTRPKPAADRIFLEAMTVLGVGGFTRYSLYYAVHWFGFAAWVQNREDRAQGYLRVQPVAGLKATATSERRNKWAQVGRAMIRKFRP
ncbi:MAG TPA: DUF1353 domain-containing protein [Gemmatimonadales bacterium]|nr:DUF1353 domain-containing protein [Gemmatimonadales bacterium]